MPLRDQLLTPIPGDDPGGVELRYDALFDKIKEARRQDDDMPQGEWQAERKTADWNLTIKLATEALATKSKDLQIAAWLTEAKVHREGFAGLRDSLDLLDGLIEASWEHLYPRIDDGDAEMRAAPLDWVGSRLELPLRSVPITRTGLDSLRYKESRFVPSEADAGNDEAKAVSRAAAIAEGKLTPEDFDRGFDGTPKAWYKTLIGDINSTIEVLGRLDGHAREKFKDAAPTFRPLRETLEDIRRVTQQLLKRKLELDPDPVETPPDPSLTGDATDGTIAATAVSVEPASVEDAAARIIIAARYLRKADPLNPASFLLLRGYRWGELRTHSPDVDPKLLEAPTTQTRTRLRGLLLDARWPELIDACEDVMGAPQGRGWLDLQRYALTACNEMGSDYHAVASTIRAELRGLLTELPSLVEMMLMDDTPTANAETRAWLRSSIFALGRVEIVPPPALTADAANGNGADAGPVVPVDEEREGGAAGRPRDARALAQQEARAGRADRAIALLMREAAKEKTPRGRFLVQAQLAGIMVDAGHDRIAMPMLEELLSAIESHKLEDWEAGDLVAQPMALLYRCLEKADGDPALRQSLYLRICKLDPLQALSFSQT